MGNNRAGYGFWKQRESPFLSNCLSSLPWSCGGVR
jgi:hypothetical protein